MIKRLLVFSLILIWGAGTFFAKAATNNINGNGLSLTDILLDPGLGWNNVPDNGIKVNLGSDSVRPQPTLTSNAPLGNIRYGSTDPAVATIDGNGTITYLSVGNAVIYAVHDTNADNDGYDYDSIALPITVVYTHTLTLVSSDTDMGTVTIDENRVLLDEPFGENTPRLENDTNNEGTCAWSVITEQTSSGYTPHSGTHFAFIGHCSTGKKTRYLTKAINMTSCTSATLSFWYINRSWRGDIDALSVYYRTSPTSEWVQLFSTTSGHGSWTECVLTLPDLSDSYELAFEATDHYGYGVGIDDVLVTAISTEMPEGIEDNNDGTYTISHGTEINIKATPTTCHRFDYWSNTKNTSNFQRYIVVTSDTAIRATFSTEHYGSTDVRTACDSLAWHGVTYHASTDNATYSEPSTKGCDSVITLHLTVKHSNTGIDTRTACDHLTWHGTNYFESTNNATHTLTNIDGCDSVVTLHLTILPASDTTITAQAQDSYSWMGTTFTESGSYVHTIPSSKGCDSNITLILTITSATTPIPTLNNIMNVMLVVNHNPDNIIGVFYAYYRWYRNGVPVKEGPDADSYDESGSTLKGCYSLEVAFDADLTYWAKTDNICFGTADITTADALQATLAPNPAMRGQEVSVAVTADESEIQNVSLTIFDTYGRRIMEQGNATHFKAELPAGIYTVRITLADGRTASRRLIVK